MADNDEQALLAEDVKILHSMGYAQELSRRMHAFSNFAISFSIICILAGGITSFNIGYSTGGPFSVTVGWFIGGLFALIVAATLGQIASAYPTAGGLYHWSSILGGRGWGWATAWFNLLGLIFVVAAVDVGVYSLARDLVISPILGIDVSGWGVREQIIGLILILFTQGLLNTFGIGLVTLMTDISGFIIFAVSSVLTATFLIYGAHNFDWSALLTFTNNSGVPVDTIVDGKTVPGDPWTPAAAPFTVFLIGMLYPLYTITGFDASAHTSEETVDAQHSVPRGMVQSVLWSLLFGGAMALAFVTAIPDFAAAVKDGPNVWFNLFNNLPCPDALKNFLRVGIAVSNYLCGLACVTSVSRMIFAFARDGGLPASRLLKHVSPHWRTPIPAIWTAAVLSVLATLYSPAYSALSAGCALFLYISYVMPILAALFAFGKTWTHLGPFSLGGLFKPFAAISVIGVALLTWGGIQPPNDIVINYGIGIVVLLVVLWFGLESRRFKGPPVGTEIARRQAEIKAAEAAVGGSAD